MDSLPITFLRIGHIYPIFEPIIIYRDLVKIQIRKKINRSRVMKTKTKNNLWIARQRVGLELKQVARLLSFKSAELVSRYEKGMHLPGLEIALKLEIIYKMPVQKLFKELYKQCRREISEIKTGRQVKLSAQQSLYNNGSEKLTAEEFCAYQNFLTTHIPNQSELALITKHIISLNNSVSDFKGHRVSGK